MVIYSGQYHLGYSESRLVGKSWYETLHPEDLQHAADEHRRGNFEYILYTHGESEILTVSHRELGVGNNINIDVKVLSH